MSSASACGEEKWYSPELETCEPFLNCKEKKLTAKHSWKLDKGTNQCVLVKNQMKFHSGIAIVIIGAIIATVLFLVLDDKYFCLKK